MKRIIGVVLAGLLMAGVLVGCGSTATATPGGAVKLAGTVTTGGSTSVEKVMLALIQQFQDDNRDVTIAYEGNGSGDGITNTKSGLYAIGHSSRDLKTDGSEDGLTAIDYAIDGIAVVVNKANGVADLSKEQLFDIYTGKITNWKDVGGRDALIAVITRESGSGTRSGVADIIGLEKKDKPETALVANANEATSTGAVQTAVEANPDAIGYMSFSDVNADKVKVVKFGGVEISRATLLNGSYKLQRSFYLLVRTGATLSPEAQAFIDFVRSDAGKVIIESKNLLVPQR